MNKKELALKAEWPLTAWIAFGLMLLMSVLLFSHCYYLNGELDEMDTRISNAYEFGLERGLQMLEHDATYSFIVEKCYLGELEGSFCELLAE